MCRYCVSTSEAVNSIAEEYDKVNFANWESSWFTRYHWWTFTQWIYLTLPNTASLLIKKGSMLYLLCQRNSPFIAELLDLPSYVFLRAVERILGKYAYIPVKRKSGRRVNLIRAPYFSLAHFVLYLHSKLCRNLSCDFPPFSLDMQVELRECMV